jgi:hypothetical protein
MDEPIRHTTALALRFLAQLASVSPNGRQRLMEAAGDACALRKVADELLHRQQHEVGGPAGDARVSQVLTSLDGLIATWQESAEIVALGQLGVRALFVRLDARTGRVFPMLYAPFEEQLPFELLLLR